MLKYSIKCGYNVCFSYQIQFKRASLVTQSVKIPPAVGSIPGLGRSPREGNGNPLQYTCLENLMDRGAWWAAVHGITKSRAQLSD